MSKILKNIPVFCLWVAGLSFYAHLLVPHDHHLADSFANKDDDCPVSSGKPGHSSGFPIHCYAFNDLTSEKATTYFFSKNIRYNVIEIRSSFDPFSFELQLPGTTVYDIHKPITNSHYPGLNPLRAPPSLS